MITAGVWPLYLQVLGLGLVWTTLHCSGMCGPIVVGIGLGRRGDQRTAWTAIMDVGCYQSGRAVVYALLGAVVGGIGSGATAIFSHVAPWVTLALGLLLGALALRDWWPRSWRGAQRPSRIALWAGKMVSVWPHAPRRRAFVMGCILAFLPCMLLFWVLSLAAASGSWYHGAAITVLLVVMTVPVLCLSAMSPMVVGRWRRQAGPWASRLPLAISASWLLCIGLAGLDVISHAGIRVGEFVVMLW